MLQLLLKMKTKSCNGSTGCNQDLGSRTFVRARWSPMKIRSEHWNLCVLLKLVETEYHNTTIRRKIIIILKTTSVKFRCLDIQKIRGFKISCSRQLNHELINKQIFGKRQNYLNSWMNDWSPFTRILVLFFNSTC